MHLAELTTVMFGLYFSVTTDVFMSASVADLRSPSFATAAMRSWRVFFKEERAQLDKTLSECVYM